LFQKPSLKIINKKTPNFTKKQYFSKKKKEKIALPVKIVNYLTASRSSGGPFMVKSYFDVPELKRLSLRSCKKVQKFKFQKSKFKSQVKSFFEVLE